MSDDRQEPPTGKPDDDRTHALPPPKPEASPDETMPIDRAAAAGREASPDQTMPIDRAASAGREASPDQTVPFDRAGPSGDRTARMPVERSTTPPWSGRAEVQAPRPAEPTGDWYVEEQGGRRWWLPILWGVLALLLAGLLGAAVWVLLDARDDDPDNPGPTPSLPSATATSAAPTSAAPTSAAPTSATPSSPPTSAPPEQVPVPPLTGLTQATAEGLLDRLGLAYRVVYRQSELPPGTVVSTEPEAGTSVSTDEEVLLVISQGRPSTGTGSASPSPTGTP